MIQLTVQTAERLGLDYEVTIVDDGSEAHTLELLDDIESRFPQVHVHRHESNKGYGGALRTGFASGTKEWIFYTDGDCQYDVREMELLMEFARDDVDIVQGYKITRNDPFHRIIIGRVYHWIVKLSFRLKIRDTDCDFRLIRRSVFDKVHLKEDSGVICAELLNQTIPARDQHGYTREQEHDSLPGQRRRVPHCPVSSQDHRPRENTHDSATVPHIPENRRGRIEYPPEQI